MPVSADGTVVLTVKADEIYTLTTLNTGSKGSHPSENRSESLDPALPLPYGPQTFDAEVRSHILKTNQQCDHIFSTPITCCADGGQARQVLVHADGGLGGSELEH